MSVTPQRLVEIESLLRTWLAKKHTTKSELQSLIGKLSFVSKCVRQSRLFISRMLALLRTLKHNHYRTRITLEFRRDLLWWQRFLRTYNGISILSCPAWSAPDVIFSTDACLTGCSGVSQHAYFHTSFPPAVTSQFSLIHHFEAPFRAYLC